jgi:hypothetical protein
MCRLVAYILRIRADRRKEAASAPERDTSDSPLNRETL